MFVYFYKDFLFIELGKLFWFFLDLCFGIEYMICSEMFFGKYYYLFLKNLFNFKIYNV